ncbi:MAG: hypothetical protein OXI91_01795 [Chloroflexota bacterium]|nr:hypothetical protein [Chloroflexota bacterium]
MPDLTEAEILTLARAAGVTIPPELVAEVGYSLNGVLEALDNIDLPDLDQIEPLPIILPGPPADAA